MSKEFVKYLYFNLSGVYNGKKPLVDLTDIPGTDYYCDDAAKGRNHQKRIDGWDRLDYSGNDIENCEENVDGTVEDDSKFNDNSHVNGLKRIPTVRFISTPAITTTCRSFLCEK